MPESGSIGCAGTGDLMGFILKYFPYMVAHLSAAL